MIELARYFLRLGAVGFGGPIALVGRMHRDLVETRRWLGEPDYREGLALAQLAPGPLAAQLAMYIGWTRGGALGALAIGTAFVLPSLLMVLTLSALYVRYDGISWLQDAFYGVNAAVIALIARSTTKLLATTLGGDRMLWGLFAVNACITAWTESERISIIVVSGLLVVVARRRRMAAGIAVAMLPASLAAVGGAAATTSLADVLWFFTKAGMVVFGSGLAIVPFLYAGVVGTWLTERQFLDAVAVSMLTPGPVVITVAFIGYLVAGLGGALVAALGVFLPAYLVVVAVAPHFRRLAANTNVRAFVDGVTAAAVGALAGAVIVLGRRAIVDVPTVMICVASIALGVSFRRVQEPLLLLAAGGAGLLLRGAGS